MPPIQKFVHLKQKIPASRATELFAFLKETIPWGAGVPSRSGPTRLAYALRSEDELVTLLGSAGFDDVTRKIQNAIAVHALSSRRTVAGVYLNYYRTGDDWTPNHTHPGSSQLVVSLGATRGFAYGKKLIASENGDILVFGSGLHGVPKESSVTEGRISIALFLD